jgi:Cu(I)/Ag(I) efflux system protein CusF
MKKVIKLLMVLAAAATIPLASHAAERANSTKETVDNAQKSSTLPMADGEIMKIDKAAGKMTIKHGPLANLSMPGMTMVFRVNDAGMLDQVKTGDKVKFSVEKLNGVLTVTALEAVK